MTYTAEEINEAIKICESEVVKANISYLKAEKSNNENLMKVWDSVYKAFVQLIPELLKLKHP